MVLNGGSFPVVFLFGPTAVGKTRILFDLFSEGFEVVNADSIQVYRYLDIGSAKASESERAVLPHHLIDIIDPWEHFNVADFVRLADIACKQILSRGNIPVISGGTAFYFRSFLYGLSQAPASNEKTRNEVAAFIEKEGAEKAYMYLREIDPVTASKVNINDTYRISRAIEVFRDSGRILSSFEVPRIPRDGMQVLSIGLCRDKAELDARIRERVASMFKEGLVQEIRMLLDMGANESWQGMQGIGYREFLGALRQCGSIDKIDTGKVMEEIAVNSIHYAKRQMTFFRSFSDTIWCNAVNAAQIRNMAAQLRKRS